MNRRTDINDFRPSSLSHLVGQNSVKKQVSVALEAAFAEGPPVVPSHMLMLGPAGVGKTSLAHTVSAELANELVEVLGQNLSNQSELNATLLSLTDARRCLFIDEAHEIPKSQQIGLLMALDQRKIVFQGRGGPQSIKLPEFCLMMATTDPHLLIAPLVSRMRLVLRFQYYNETELSQIVLHRSRALGWDLHEATIPEISKRGRGVPRAALRLLQAARRCQKAAGDETINPDHLHQALEMEGVDELGLVPLEREYLRILVDGPTRLNVLCSFLGEQPRSLSQTIEPFLIRSNLIVKDEAGRRTLTARGYEHVQNRPEIVQQPS